METIKVGNENGRRQHEHMSEKKIRTPKRELDDLDDKLPSGLRHDMRTQPTFVPASRPPRTIHFIVFELSRKEHCDQNLVNGALNGEHTDKTENGMRCVPKLQEPLKEQKLIKQTTHKKQPQTYQKLKEAKHANNTKDMSNERHHGAEFLGPRKREIKKSANRIAAFHTMGPKTAYRMSGLEGYVPSESGNDLTNMYKRTAMNIGKRTSEKMTARLLEGHRLIASWMGGRVSSYCIW